MGSNPTFSAIVCGTEFQPEEKNSIHTVRRKRTSPKVLQTGVPFIEQRGNIYYFRWVIPKTEIGTRVKNEASKRTIPVPKSLVRIIKFLMAGKSQEENIWGFARTEGQKLPWPPCIPPKGKSGKSKSLSLFPDEQE